MKKIDREYENIAVNIHRHLIMNRRVSRLAQAINAILPDETKTLLDVGAGSGEMAIAVGRLRDNLVVEGVDVFIRPNVQIPVKAYDGYTLPFENNAFDVVMLIDVLHHCDDPEIVLKECKRVSRHYILIKDHIADSHYDTLILRLMDWIGNRAHGVQLPFKYFSTAAWEALFSALGLKKSRSYDDLALYPKPINWLFGGTLHCCWLLATDAK